MSSELIESLKGYCVIIGVWAVVYLAMELMKLHAFIIE